MSARAGISGGEAWPATTPSPPYFAVIFTSLHSADTAGYAETARRMEALASAQPGFLGIETVREGERGITVSYWRSERDIARWKAELEHAQAQRRGRKRWYRRYSVRVVRVIRAYDFAGCA